MELRHLRYFVAVAENLSFRKAAEQLSLSQPPLSQQIRQLERELGVPLLTRSTRHVELTSAGSVLLRRARQILKDVDEAALDAQITGEGHGEPFTVSFVTAAANTVLPLATIGFREMFPRATLRLREKREDNDAVVRGLHDGRIDAAILRPSVARSWLAVRPLLEEEFVAALPQAHPLAGRTRVSMTELLAEPMIVWDRSIAPEVNSKLFGDRFAIKPSRVAIEVAGIQTILGLVSAGLGVSCLPISFSLTARPGVVFRRLEDPRPTIGLVAVWRRDNPSELLRAFVANLEKSIIEVRRTLDSLDLAPG